MFVWEWAHAIAHTWKSEGSLRCRSSPSALFETGSAFSCSLNVCQASSPWAAGDSPVPTLVYEAGSLPSTSSARLPVWRALGICLSQPSQYWDLRNMLIFLGLGEFRGTELRSAHLCTALLPSLFVCFVFVFDLTLCSLDLPWTYNLPASAFQMLNL